MAEEYVPFDVYRADLADFRADMARFREEVRADLGSVKVELAQMETRLTRLHSQTIIWLAGCVATGVALTVTLIKVIP